MTEPQSSSIFPRLQVDWTTVGMMRVCCVAFIVVTMIFLPYPEIDLWVAEIFYYGNNDFWLRKTEFNVILNDFIRPAVRYVAIGGLLAFLYFWWRAPLDRVRKLARYAFFLICIALASGLVVHAVLKDNWGRARPKHVVQFDGEQVFTPPLLPVNECERNCSFVSGDSSLGFVFLSFALYAARHRRFWISLTVASGLALGLMRMMNGSHFFSDILYSGIFTCFTVLLLYRWFEERRFKQDAGILYPAFAAFGSLVFQIFEKLPVPPEKRAEFYARSRALFTDPPDEAA